MSAIEKRIKVINTELTERKWARLSPKLTADEYIKNGREIKNLEIELFRLCELIENNY
jgi:hypothetical protein